MSEVISLGASPRRHVHGIALWACVLAVCVAAPAWAQFEIPWFTIDGGGGQSASIAYQVSGTIGQSDAGLLTGGPYEIEGGFWSAIIPSLVAVDPGQTPREGLTLRLDEPSPNPLVHESVVAFELPEARNVRLAVYDAAGRVMKTLANGSLEAGQYRRVWDGRDDAGRSVATGLYFLRYEAGDFRAWRKIAVVR